MTHSTRTPIQTPLIQIQKNQKQESANAPPRKKKNHESINAPAARKSISATQHSIPISKTNIQKATKRERSAKSPVARRPLVTPSEPKQEKPHKSGNKEICYCNMKRKNIYVAMPRS